MNISSLASDFWADYENFTEYRGIVKDKFNQKSNMTYHFVKNSKEKRKLWYRTTDLAIVYEEFEGFANSDQSGWVKVYEGGIVENRWMYTGNF